MELRQYLSLVRNWLWLMILGAVLSGTISYVVSKDLPKVYQASTTLIVGTVITSPNPEYSSVLAGQLMAKTYSRILTSRPILEGAIQSLNLQDSLTPNKLAAATTVETVRDTQLVVLRVRSQNPDLAASLANAMSTELISQSPTSPQGQLGSVMTFVRQQMSDLEVEISSHQRRIKEIKDKQATTPVGTASVATATATADELASLEGKLRSAQERYGTLLTVRTGMSTSYVSVIERAAAPISPISPNVINNAALAAIIGLLLAAGTAFFIEYLDDTAKSPEMIDQVTGAPTLGVVTRLSRRDIGEGLVTLRAPKSSAAEAFRSLRTSIQFSSPDKPINSLVVTSADPGDGKTTILCNLAVSMAQAGLKVIVVDTDLRRPTVHKRFGLPNNLGLTSLLSGQASEIGSVVQLTDEPNLFVVSSGPLPPNPSELLNSQRIQNVFDRLQQQADLLLLDSPPVLAVSDAVILASRADGVVLVVDAGHTRMVSLRHSVESLRKVGANLLGIVLNKVGPGRGRYYYYYNYYYYYSYSSDTEQETAAKNGHSSWLNKLLTRGGEVAGRRKQERQ